MVDFTSTYLENGLIYNILLRNRLARLKFLAKKHVNSVQKQLSRVELAGMR
jgi:hypothetical protein